ncbi:uncharacterized protein LOC106052984 isoform X3 [Biomphalaria glabrata]|uniref:Uncharacterized protein LOC106052984 isoform X3 n=1 Tax=Biomphalaria glabrata TaxID=6526 RepID=A0A9W3BL75_BIOGL|nr:uncharacterized protein LOC106052984 isoform X3 [Biomphalaria glabrata]
MSTGVVRAPTAQQVELPPVTISTSVKLSTNAHPDVDRIIRMSHIPFEGCRKKTLKCINSRPFLITICVLVVVECACVLAELMVDLQGIKFRFENEETEINRFVNHLYEKYPEAFVDMDMKSMSGVISVLEQSFVFRTKEDLLSQQSGCECSCSCDSTTTASSPATTRAPTAAASSVEALRALLPILKLVAETTNNLTAPDDVFLTPLSFSNASDHSAPDSTNASSSPLSSLFLPSSSLPLSTPTSSTYFNSLTNATSRLSPDSSHSSSFLSISNSSNDVSSTSPSSHSTLSSLFLSSPPSLNSTSASMPQSASTSLSFNISSPQRGRRKRNSFSYNRLHYGIDEVQLNNLDPTKGLSGVENLANLYKKQGRESRSTEISVTDGGPVTDSSGLTPVSLANHDRLVSHVTRAALTLQDISRYNQLDKQGTGSSGSPQEGDLVNNDLITTHSKEIYTKTSAVPLGLASSIPNDPPRESPSKPLTSGSWSTEENLHSLEFGRRQKRQVNRLGTETLMTQGSSGGAGPTTSTSQALYSRSETSSKAPTSAPSNTVPQNTKDEMSMLTSTVSFVNNNSLPTKTSNEALNVLAGNQTATFASIPSTLTLTEKTYSNSSTQRPQIDMAASSVIGATVASSTVANSTTRKPVALEDIFVLEINNIMDSFYLVAEFVPNRVGSNDTKNVQYNEEYSKVYKSSKALHFISLSILSVMVLETAIKLFCTGCAFFKKKFEVFDAFIVVSSFALDFVFLDSRWYETGKDATTILVLLLPWRVVRIVNSFLMTMKHKHHIQMMNMKRARKKAELKAAKLQTLLSEVRKDVQLLVALCRSNEIEEKDITACLYGKGRRSVTLSAMSTCTSLMLISTLGKDAVQEDDIYGKVFKEALNEGDNAEMNSEIQQAEEAAIDAAIELDEKIKARRKSKKYKSKKTRVKRSYTVPRRTASVDIPEPDINENDSNIFYINDSYLRAAAQATSPSGSGDFPPVPGGLTNCNMVSEEDEHHCNHTGHTTAVAQTSARSKYQSTASLRSLPVRKGSRSNSMVTFEVTTQVTYL